MTYRNKHEGLTGLATKRIRTADSSTESPRSGAICFRRWPNLYVDAKSPMARFLIGNGEKLVDLEENDPPSVRRMMFSAIDPETP